MSHDEIPLSDLGGGGGASATFPELGVAYEGTITALRRSVQTNPQTGEVQTFTDGTPRPVTVITIDTGKGEGDVVSLWAKGGNFQADKGKGDAMEVAIAKAAKDAGAKALRVGDWLRVEHTGLTKQPANKAISPAKLYTAEYRVDKGSIDLGLFSDDES